MKNQNDMIKEVQALLEKGQIEEAIRLMESVPEADKILHGLCCDHSLRIHVPEDR